MEKKKEERKRSRSWCNDTRTHTHTSLPNITFLLPHPLLAVPRSFALIIIVFTPSFAIGFHRHPRQERSKYDNMQNFFKQTILWWESKQIDSKNHATKAKQTFFFSSSFSIADERDNNEQIILVIILIIDRSRRFRALSMIRIVDLLRNWRRTSAQRQEEDKTLLIPLNDRHVSILSPP